jgi:nucleotide-binding universal stress UspA family protein
MLATGELEPAFASTGAPALGDGPSLRRILVAVRAPGEAAGALAVAARACRTIGGVLSLVHVRTYDRPVRRAGRFYPETAGDAGAVPGKALLAIWGYGGPRATTAVVDAERREAASAIAWQASLGRADLIVLTRRPGLAVSCLVMDCVPDQVMRQANCPVLAVHPGRNDRGRGSRQLPFKQSPRRRWTNSRPSADASDPARHHCRPGISLVCRRAGFTGGLHMFRKHPKGFGAVLNSSIGGPAYSCLASRGCALRPDSCE